jgi:glucosamine-6-phosphate deaminase
VKLTVFRNERDAADAVADRIARDLRERPALVLGLPTGRTPVLLYRRLVALHASGQLDLSRAFWRVPPDHPASYRAYMERHLFGHVGIARSQTHFLDGMAPEAAAECERYENAIAAAGGIDIQVLGIGANGHIGFNEPAVSLQARTHKATLKPQTRRANATFFENDAARVPPEALSMGMATILRARSIILLAMGRGKGRAVERLVNGPLTTRLPASFLQIHTDVEVVIDEAAAERLTDSQRVSR